MKITPQALRSLSATILILLFSGQPVWADDTEVLIGPGGVAWATPNVLFIMDTSGSMGTVDNRSIEPRSRLKIVQDVFADLMRTNSGINVGLMRFASSGNGGYFVSPMQQLNASSRTDIIAASDSLHHGGNTPLAETLYEATRYYRGMSVDFGTMSVSGARDPDNSSNYLSPITSQCQANYVILLTDGVPHDDDGADNSPRIPDLPGYSSGSCAYSADDCLDEVADYLHTVDQRPGSAIPGDQTVDTYTIGFRTSQTLLQDTATNGGGEYLTANNAAELSTAFADILSTIAGTNDSFSPPAMAANSFSGISHFNKLYYALFEPSATPKWDGNVKPYTLAGDPPQLTDADDIAAVDSSGYFLDTSRSLWSLTDDGAHIADGGANGRLPTATDRKLYTYTDGYDSDGIPDTPALTADSNALKAVATSDLTAAMLGLSNPDPVALATEFSSVIDTVRGYKLGAPLHSQPVLVTYGGTEADPTMTLFTATNDGFLHALDANTGVEQFAFIPQELLPNLPTLTRGTGTHPYGLDGDISAWVTDVNNDHIITRSEGDHVYLYVGMRRGGNNYYALDVTDTSAPTLKWVILGGASGNANFTELGQTWSRPTVTRIPYGAGSKTVLIFGGGYDSAQDANPLNADDSIGRAIYIVDADTGQRLWWAGASDSGADLELPTLTNSIPSEVTTFDSDLDGDTDRLYVGDMRGQVFRIDLRATATGVSASGVRLANLGGTTEADNRRFYYPPDVVFTRRSGSPSYLSLNIGSGYRAHPLNPVNADGTAAPRVNDRFYSLRDPNVLGSVPAGFTTITNGSLFDATSSLVTTSSDIDSLAAANGWFITLGAGSGEKVLAPSLTINGEIFFSTYTPPASVTRSDCAPPPGVGRLYRVSLFDATPVVDETGDGAVDDVEDRAGELDRPGIPPAPAAHYHQNADGSVDLIIMEGTESERVPDAIQMKPAYWRDDS